MFITKYIDYFLRSVFVSFHLIIAIIIRFKCILWTVHLVSKESSTHSHIRTYTHLVNLPRYTVLHLLRVTFPPLHLLHSDTTRELLLLFTALYDDIDDPAKCELQSFIILSRKKTDPLSFSD